MVRKRDKASKEKNNRDFDKRKKPKTRRLRLGTRSWWPDARPQPRQRGCQETEEQTAPLTVQEINETAK